MQQPMLNPKDITNPTTAMNMELVLMAKAFKLNYSTPTNNNQRISSNPHSRQIAQPGMNLGSRTTDADEEESSFLEMQFHNLDKTHLLIAKRRSRDPDSKPKILILMAAGRRLDRWRNVNANYILMANLQQQQASTSSTSY
ncbi:hypothetical protein Tco_0232938 [Tanacetum coccineum]